MSETTDLYRSEVCFVCNREVVNKGIFLSMEKTCFTNTAFAAKLSELIGDTFMVVVSEEDRLCARCVRLINSADKLEVELTEIRRLITEFLNIKYNLSNEDSYLNSSEGFDHSKVENDCQDLNLTELPSASMPHNESTQVGYQQSLSRDRDNKRPNQESTKSNNFIKSALGNNVHIKSEPPPCKYANPYFDSCNSISFNDKPNTQFVSKVLLRKLPEDDSFSDGKPSALKPFSCKTDSRVPQHSHDGIMLKEVKQEKLSTDCSVSNPTAFTLRTPDERNTLTFDRSDHCDETSVSNCITTSEVKRLPLLDEEPPTAPPSCSPEKEISLDESPSQATLNKKSKDVLAKKSSLKPRPVRNCSKRVMKNASFGKLRPILPKLHFVDIFTPLIERSSQSSLEVSSTDSLNNAHVKNSDGQVKSKNSDIAENRTLDAKPNGDASVADDDLTGTKESLQNVNSTDYRCSFCKEEFEDLETLKSHEKEHIKYGENYRCGVCQKVFKTKTGLRHHLAVHTGRFSYCCDFCGLGLMSRKGLEEHRSSHTKEERYICDVCGKKFIFNSTYWIHRKWHDNPLPYKCNDCGRLFKHTSLLSVHRRKHTGERPYKCSYCSLTFNVSTSLKRHLILHTKNYPYTCDTCKQGFTTRFRYTEHLCKTHNIIVDKPPVEKKNYKVAVYDEPHDSATDTVSSDQPVTVENSECGPKDAVNSVTIITNDPSEGLVEIVLRPSSVLSEHSLTLSDSWLT